jgi:citrate lyase subunit beta/citryl-CoA lyase
MTTDQPPPPKPVRLERSLLAVPASNWRMVEKAVASAADAVFLDLEDAVAPSQKEQARANVIRALRELDWGRKIRLCRINGLATPWAYRDLIEIVEAAGDQLDCILLPKANRPEDLYVVDVLLTEIEQYKGLKGRVGIEALIETAMGMIHVNATAFASGRLEALNFGPGDYTFALDIPLEMLYRADGGADYPGHHWHYAMHRIVVAARAAGLRAIDGPYPAIADLDGYRRACRMAKALGFDGKWCVHPTQIPIANEVFAPSPEEIRWMQRVVHEMEQAMAEGRGAIQLDGRLVEVPFLAVARRTLEKARLAGLL